ncbi:mediator-associated protein 2 [Phtheirospermum japonicum]|uniref:Mediator-associated protein 2 n=1 Tax=Phtheirospermum japonicum TaxID=374723 RepID=A0A830BQM5_9LAMI|nr:mediator-associated protein 2 [Phtheirospermum japonicum]
MDVSDSSYQPPAGFVEDKKDPLIDLNLTDSTELWLIHWTTNQPLDFDGQHVSMKLGGDGRMCTVEGSSGKSYDMISYKSQGPEATVFLTSASEAKIAGKISRRVSLIHYPDPSEFQKRNSLNISHSQRSSGATSTMSGRRHATPSRSVKPTKSTVSGYSNPPKVPKRKRDEPSKSTSHSGRDSGKGTSGVTSTGSMEHSQERKSKKKMKV